MDSMMKKCDEKISEVDEKMEEIKKEEIKFPEIIPETAIETRDKLESLEGEDNKLKIDAVGHLQEKLDTLKSIAETNKGGRIGWGAHPIQIQDDGTVVTKIARLINFIGATITQARDGTTTIAFSGAGFTTLTATETPNGVLTVFTFASATAKPSYIISDNVWLKPISKAGTVNWTWLGTEATLTIPPLDDCWGVA